MIHHAQDVMHGSVQPPHDAFGLYIHIPFCEKKCPYCDFNTYAGLDATFGAMVEALCAEMATWRTRVTDRTVSTIFVGGGTPTVLDAGLLGQLFQGIDRHFTVAADAEITCEANPGTVDRAKFGVLRDLGVNRLSLGVQSFQPDELRFLGRIHDVDDVYRAVDSARAVGFDNLNLDFIFGLPHQQAEQWHSTMEQAIGLDPEHLSLYSLIVEPNTPLNHWVDSGRVDAPDDDQAGLLYEMAMAALDSAGYLHYEVSNWAKRTPADEPCAAGTHNVPALACRHNLIYWRNQEYLGIGPGAHSHLRVAAHDQAEAVTEQRWANRKPVAGYINRLRQELSVEEFSETLTPDLSMGETMMLGLRLLDEGVEFARFRRRHQADLRHVYASQLQRFVAQQLLTADDIGVRLTRQGLMVGNQVFMEFLPDTPID